MESPAASAPEAAAPRLYRRFWRWHFYAAFLVIPFVLLQSTTGTLYLWHEEWADWAHPELRFVPPSDGMAGYDAQVAAAQAAHPEARATTLLVPDDPRRATQVMFGSDHDRGLPFPVFVNPHDGHVLGSVSPWAWMPGWTRQVHGGWPFGDAGSWLLELGACWAIVMVLTGLFLWWPRDGGWLRALWPRTGKGARVLVRDLHACVAVWFSLVLMVFLVSALPWTSFWGDHVLKPFQALVGQPSPFGAGARVKSIAQPGVAPVSLDEAVAGARKAGLKGPLEVRLGAAADAPQVVRNRLPRASQEASVAFDRYSREPRAMTTWEDYRAIPRAVATGVDLHEGTFFGRANQWFNTIFALALVWLSVTGLLAWWLRRPQGTLGAPRRAEVRVPRAVWIGGGVLCLVLPLLGLSVIALWLTDEMIARSGKL